MARWLVRFSGLLLALAGLFPGPAGFGRAAEPAFAGTWKVTLLSNGGEITLWLVRLQEQGGKPQAEILAAGPPAFKDSRIESIRLEGEALHLAIRTSGPTFHLVAYIPPGKAKPEELRGYAAVGGRREFARLEQTDQKELSPAQVMARSPGFEEFVKAARTQDASEKQKAFEDFLGKHPEGPLAYHAALELTALLTANGAAEAAIRTRADQAIAQAAAYGPEMKRQATEQVARQLLASGKQPALAVAYAEQADKLLDKSVPAAEQAAVLKMLASALRKAGKADAARNAVARAAAFDVLLDREFARNEIPFKPERAPARPGKGGRVVLVELFTGAQCPPCVAADIAFDALLETYGPADVAAVEYHVHVPGPDPLTNPDAEKRAEFYGIPATPFDFLNGKEGTPPGGFKQHAEDRYETLRKEVAKQLEAAPQAGLRVTARQAGDQVRIHAEVTDLKKTGEDVRLRLALVEDVVHYVGANGQRLHHHVFRGFAGGVDGLPLKQASARHEVTVSLGALRQSLAAYLEEYAKKRSFPNEDRPLELKGLKVIAFVQDDSTKDVLQAAQADVAGGR